MPKVSPGDVEAHSLPSRTYRELVSGSILDAESVTLRLVELEPAREAEPRHPHAHERMEEIIYLLDGVGKTWIEGEVFDVAAGDAVLYPRGQRHMTVNTGTEPLRLLAFFPHPDITQDFVVDEETTFPVGEL